MVYVRSLAAVASADLGTSIAKSIQVFDAELLLVMLFTTLLLLSSISTPANVEKLPSR